MVQPRSSRPQRRNRNAGPGRATRGGSGSTPKPEAKPSTRGAHVPPPPEAVDEELDETLDPIRYPNLAAAKEQDRLEHVRKAREAGLTRKQASDHADEHMRHPA